jgi:hypothetical protein
MTPNGFEPNNKRPQTHTLHRTVTDIGPAKFGVEDFKTIALHKRQVFIDKM